MNRTLTFHTFFFIFCLVIMRMSGLISKMAMARYITPYEYGLITLITISLPSMFQYITNFCLHDLLSHSKEGKSYFGFAVFYSFITSLIVALFLFMLHEPFFKFLNLPLDIWKILFIAFFIAMFPLGILADTTGLLRGLKKYTLTSAIASLPSVIKLLLVIFAIYLFHITDFITILFIFASSSLIALIIIIIRYHNLFFSFLNSFNLPSKQIFFFGTSVFIVSLFGGLNQIISKVVISHDLGITLQGYFDVSLTLISLLSFSFAAMSFISIPEATGAEKKEEILFKRGELGDVVRGLFALLIFCVILLYFYAPLFIKLLFGNEYIKAADYIMILAIGSIFSFVQKFVAYINISLHKAKEYRNMIIATLICLSFSPILTHIFIEFMGFMGAYISSTLLLIIYTLSTMLSSKDFTPLFALSHRIDKLILSSAVIFFFLYIFYILSISFIYGISLSFLIFVFLLFLFGYIDKNLIFGIFERAEVHDK